MDINELVNQHERDIGKYTKILAKSTTPDKQDRADHCTNKIGWHKKAVDLLLSVATAAGASSGAVLAVKLGAELADAVLGCDVECNHVIGRGWLRTNQDQAAPMAEIVVREQGPHPDPRNWTKLYRFCPACGVRNEGTPESLGIVGSDRFNLYLESQA